MERRHGAKPHVNAKHCPSSTTKWCRRETPERSEDRPKAVEFLDGVRGQRPRKAARLSTQREWGWLRKGLAPSARLGLSLRSPVSWPEGPILLWGFGAKPRTERSSVSKLSVAKRGRSVATTELSVAKRGRSVATTELSVAKRGISRRAVILGYFVRKYTGIYRKIFSDIE